MTTPNDPKIPAAGLPPFDRATAASVEAGEGTWAEDARGSTPPPPEKLGMASRVVCGGLGTLMLGGSLYMLAPAVAALVAGRPVGDLGNLLPYALGPVASWYFFYAARFGRGPQSGPFRPNHKLARLFDERTKRVGRGDSPE